jgi:hypothetical protein
MTLMGAINHIDAIKPNAYNEDEKKKWLSTLDGLVYEQIWATHEGAEINEFNGYNAGTDLSTELLVKAPFDEIYIKWLEAQIDYATGEFGKYNNSMTMFNSAFDGYARYYNRTHTPKSKDWTHF